MSFSLGCDGIYTGGWDNAWGRVVYEEKQRHQQWERETAAYNRSVERRRQEKQAARTSAVPSYSSPAVYKPVELTPEQKAKLEAERKIRREAQAEKDQLRQRYQQQSKAEWDSWRQLPLTSRLSRLAYWMSPGYIDQFLFERTQAAVEVAELNQRIAICPQPEKLFAVKQAQRTFAIVNRLTRRWLTPAVVSGFALFVTLVASIVAGLVSGNLLVALLTCVLSAYAVNAAKLVQYSLTVIGFIGIYRVGVAARSLMVWLRDFLHALFRTLLMLAYFGISAGLVLLTLQFFAG